MCWRLFGLLSLVFVPDSLATSTLFGLLAAMSFPKSSKFLQSKLPVTLGFKEKSLVAAVFFFAAIGTAPSYPPSQNAQSPTPETTPVVQEVSTPEPSAEPSPILTLRLDVSPAPSPDASSIEPTLPPPPSLATSPASSPVSSPRPTPVPTPVPTPKPSPRPSARPSPVVVEEETPPAAPIQQFFAAPVEKQSGGTYTCDCSKTCAVLSCAEAQFQLNSCGCSRRDADSDGIACDADCQ